jgi:type VI secretion system secreted protein Hcp
MAKSDMFLKVDGSKSGTIKGESNDAAHRDEIDIAGWSWGMRAQTEMGGAGSSSKSSMRELLVRKKVDSASTPLMSAMRNNEQIKSAVLTVRKSGKQPLEYFKVTIENGRITSIDVESVEDDSPDLIERVSFSFQRISVEYVPQGADGGPRGSMLFETETF